MKSLEAKFNEALAELKKKAPAKKYDEVCKEYMKLPTIEAKLNCVEAALGTVKESTNPLQFEDLEEAKRNHAILFGLEPRPKASAKENAPITKHAGAVEMFVEGNPFNEGRTTGVTNNTEADDRITKKKKKLIESTAAAMGISKQAARGVLGLPPKKPKGYKDLNEQQRRDFDFAIAIGISEADAFKLTKVSLTEVSR